MSLRTESYNVRQLYGGVHKASLNESGLKEVQSRTSPKIRMKSELRTTKMPPINGIQLNDSRQNGKFSQQGLRVGESPLRNIDNRANLERRAFEENASYDKIKGLRASKNLSVETANDPKNYSNSVLRDLNLQSASNSNSFIASLLNTNTNKASNALNSFSGSYSNKSQTNTRLKGLSPKKFVNMKMQSHQPMPQPLPIELKSNSYDNFNGSMNGVRLEKSELISPTKNPLMNPTPVLPYFEPTKCSTRKNGIVKAYAANTNQGIVRNYNEDRVAIILNIMKPPNLDTKEEWPICSFFGVYDGHGGTNCADFLRDNLHQFVTKN